MENKKEIEIDYPGWSGRVILERVVNETGVPILDLPKKPVGFVGVEK